MVQISLQNSHGKVVFLGGVHGNPIGHQQEWKYLGHLSVKLIKKQVLMLTKDSIKFNGKQLNSDHELFAYLRTNLLLLFPSIVKSR